MRGIGKNLLLFACFFFIHKVDAGAGKYSREKNEKQIKDDTVLNSWEDAEIISEKRTITPIPQEPFRMSKLNSIWQKAQKVNPIDLCFCKLVLIFNSLSGSFLSCFQILNSIDLQALHDDLSKHDKEELTMKRLRHEGGDKVSLKRI